MDQEDRKEQLAASARLIIAILIPALEQDTLPGYRAAFGAVSGIVEGV